MEEITADMKDVEDGDSSGVDASKICHNSTEDNRNSNLP